MKFTIGTDIEVMLKKAGVLVSAIPILKDAEDEKVDKLPFGKIFYDNVLAEFTVKPAQTEEEFRTHIVENLKAAEKMFQAKGLDIFFASSAHYPKTQLRNPIAKRFGCSPDYNAYDMIVNEVAVTASETTLRSAGAHVHFAHETFKGVEADLDVLKMVEMIKMMDLLLGVPSLILDNTPEAHERRKLYGKAGAHRPKPEYPGGEYRTISNFWTKEPKFITWVWNNTHKALEEIVAGNTVTKLGFDEKEVRNTINSGDVKKAEALCTLVDKKLNFNALAI